MTGAVPPEATTMEEIVAGLEASGFTAQMAARPGGAVLCFACHQESPAGEVQLEALGRTEGASDPADMLAVAGLICPRCGARGTVVLGYGPEADPDDSEVLAILGDG